MSSRPHTQEGTQWGGPYSWGMRTRGPTQPFPKSKPGGRGRVVRALPAFSEGCAYGGYQWGTRPAPWAVLGEEADIHLLCCPAHYTDGSL